MTVKRVLVLFNFSAFDERVLHYVIKTYAGQKNIEVTLFHVYTPLPAIDRSSPRLGALRSTLAGMWTEIREKAQDLRTVKDDLIENGFDENQIKTVFRPRTKSIAAEIVDAVREGNYTTVVMSREPGKATRIFTANIHDALLSALRDMEIVIII
ncbi:MAG: universal stress protein [Desulfobacteraceae bacterium]|jgi:hypothetical protein|nr:MAG: universal stress protein [Desulfobacteraceae bacterium]